jgi:hypothetical protein
MNEVADTTRTTERLKSQGKERRKFIPSSLFYVDVLSFSNHGSSFSDASTSFLLVES